MGVSDDQEALSQLKAGVGWKNRYLFVRESCGGGNAWRCNVDHIFRVNGDRLVELGVIFAHPESRDAGSGYGEGYFRDVYNKLEMNSITSHAAAPGFWVWLKEKNGRLVADLGRTWRENAAGYAERVEKYRKRLGRGRLTEEEMEDVGAALLFNAALARYCGRMAEEREALKAAERLFDVKTLRSFRNDLAIVKPGELPGSS